MHVEREEEIGRFSLGRDEMQRIVHGARSERSRVAVIAVTPLRMHVTDASDVHTNHGRRTVIDTSTRI